MLRFVSSLLCLAGLSFCATSQLRAAYTVNVVGTYDENTSRLNAVDHSATSDGTHTLSLSSFSTLVNQAFTSGYGGVINFDTGSAFTVNPYASNPSDALIAKYGANFTKSLQITNGSVTDFVTGTDTSQRTPISGNRYLGKSGTAAPGLTLNNAGGNFIFGFSQIDQVIAVGGTLLSRAANQGVLTGRVSFSDGSTDQTLFSQAASNGGDDAFYGFRVSDAQQSQGIYITQFEILLPSGQYRGFDDLAFVVAPEPSKSLLLLAGLAFVRLRRRR